MEKVCEFIMKILFMIEKRVMQQWIEKPSNFSAVIIVIVVHSYARSGTLLLRNIKQPEES